MWTEAINQKERVLNSEMGFNKVNAGGGSESHGSSALQDNKLQQIHIKSFS